MLGLDSEFFCDAFLLWTRLCQVYPWMTPAFPKVELTAASTLGRTEEEVRNNLGMGSQTFADKYGLRLYQTAEELLEREQPDGVFICGRPSTMPAIARMAVEHGVHVFLQKPAGRNAQELRDLGSEAKRRGVVASAGQTWRYDGAAQASLAKLKAEREDIGKLCNVRIMYQHGKPTRKTWYYDEKEGGPELWLGWYPIDLLRYFTQSRIVSVYATAHGGDTSPENENVVFHASCECENGVCGNFDFYGNIKYSYPRTEWELLTERGMVRNVQRHDVEIYAHEKPQQAVYRGAFFDGIGRDINAWLHRWDGDTNDGIDLFEAADNVSVANAITESLLTRKAVKL